MKRDIILAAAWLASSAIAPVLAQHHHWGYSGEGAPSHWAELDPGFAACSSGKSQSPIDLPRSAKGGNKPLVFDYHQGGTKIFNNGHTVQVEYAPGSTLDVGGHAYELKQFHFHAPSENTIAGKHFPMEVHLVHADKQGHLAVVAVMFTQGKPNAFVETLWANMPAGESEEHPFAHALDAAALLPPGRHYYRFEGSLTTPPCSEGVTWIVLSQPVTVSKQQLAAFMHTMGFANNRPVQPLNARKVSMQ
jgi:carbonic anhydrase